MTIEQLLEIKNKIEEELLEIKSLIANYKDSFEYAVCIHSYGSHYKESFNNLYAAVEAANNYYEDNGFAHLYTNNKDIPSDIVLSGGSIFLVDSVKEIEAYSHPENAIEIRKSASNYYMDWDDKTEKDFTKDSE